MLCVYITVGWFFIVIVAIFVVPQINRALKTSAASKAAAEQHLLFAELRTQAFHITHTYLQELLRQRRQKLYKDAYGQIITNDWSRELEYFVRTVLVPRLNPSTVIAWLNATWRSLNAQAAVRGLGARGVTTVSLNFRPETAIAPLLHEVAQFIESAAALHIQDGSKANSPIEFEIQCEEQLTRAGWTARRVGGSGDQGADVLAERDGHRGVFQCKLYAQPVGNDAVQEAHAAAAFYQAHFAAVISVSGYTKGARQAAEATGVLLLDCEQLASLKPPRRS